MPITDIYAAFLLADVTWFEAEQTMFVFYRVQAEQGIGDRTRIELGYRTDDEVVPFTPLPQITPVHGHVEVDCGVNARCGSWSLHVPIVPRDVRLQMRYHDEGELVLPASTTLNVVDAGAAAHKNRSLAVYGVFDESNTRVQWRARHLFPALRNEEVTALGLRRHVEVRDMRFGPYLADAFDDVDNPYGYGDPAALVHHQTQLTELGWQPVATDERAVFSAESMPVMAEASQAALVAGIATVTDATPTGTFDAVALARKNPEVAPAFPVLHSPITNNVVLPFFLEQCNVEDLNELHTRTQRQRLLTPDDAPVICVDDFTDDGFVDDLAQQFRSAIDDKRLEGDDMVLVFALHHYDQTGALAATVQQALALVLPAEAQKSSPRCTGALVYDSYGERIVDPAVARLTLWCPANLGNDLDQIDDASMRSCPLLPDMPDIRLGPFRFNSLPILPTRAQLLTFVDRYSEAQAGRVLSLGFKAPQRSTTSRDVPVGEYGVATFFNEETLTVPAAQSLSFCQPSDPDAAADVGVVVFQGLGPDVDPAVHALPELPAYHRDNPGVDVALGILWDFPFLTRLRYESSLAGAATALDITIPFGVDSQTTSFLGAATWEASDFSIGDALLRCARFCEHPTFDSAGVYQVLQPFDAVYLDLCYRPLFPTPGDGGFPSDP
ncbi:MAG: hypothetical protein IT383_25500 [Deltaproteobacteria bacterium]|nr:hypothetical protein [Deltaproteobacteria bacterium]